MNSIPQFICKVSGLCLLRRRHPHPLPVATTFSFQTPWCLKTKSNFLFLSFFGGRIRTVERQTSDYVAAKGSGRFLWRLARGKKTYMSNLSWDASRANTRTHTLSLYLRALHAGMLYHHHPYRHTRTHRIPRMLSIAVARGAHDNLPVREQAVVQTERQQLAVANPSLAQAR